MFFDKFLQKAEISLLSVMFQGFSTLDTGQNQPGLLEMKASQ